MDTLAHISLHIAGVRALKAHTTTWRQKVKQQINGQGYMLQVAGVGASGGTGADAGQFKLVFRFKLFLNSRKIQRLNAHTWAEPVLFLSVYI